MPLPIISHTVANGLSSIPYVYPIVKTATGIAAVSLLKRYFGGATNESERTMHSKVVMITGGTSGIGASIVHDLASRGAQIIILTQQPPTDPFLVDYIEDLRTSTHNSLIYAEQVDLSSLHSIRLFATKWVDNTPPRRLDMVILCGNTMTPPSSSKSRHTIDGLNMEWQVNYLANFHLLSILSPALRAQPPDRDVRVIFATCSSYIGAELDFETLEARTSEISTSTAKPRAKKTQSSRTGSKQSSSGSSMYAASKLALMIFARSFQSHLSNYNNINRSTNQPARPTNSRVLVVDPGFSRTPGTRRWLTRGSLLGLFFYLLTWPIWWLILKSPQQGAQSFLLAAMEAGFSAVGQTEEDKKRRAVGIAGGTLIKECMERPILRDEVMDDKIAEKLWKFSQEQIEKTEKESALGRAMEKKRREKEEKKEKPVRSKKGK
ncbi:hypothetical protein PRK78_003226 [Emydomyces testavorans]|uniref:Oxidoreductase n=1 Tax=Emydomyces testavorans TaxID=2070801 RepID=A0AAF0DFN5_9EURO|nr:hypothetical protein PRK78_003226 [Emydomyces testavorans]